MNYEITSDILTFDCGCQFKVLNHKLREDGLPALDINFYDLPLGCVAAWKSFEGNTKGIFQLESSLGCVWSKKMKPKNIEELSALISLLRPGCLQFKVNNKSMTAHYIDRHNKKEESIPIDESVVDILESTYQVMTYQEQLMAISRKVAGFSLKEADILRRAVGQKLPDLMTQVEQTFIDGVKQTGLISEERGKLIWDSMRKSERYLFNKSHGISYSYLGYWSSFIKSHFPLLFYISWLSFAKYKLNKKEEIRDLIRNAKYSGIKVNNPSIKHLSSEFSIKDKQIWFGLSNIKGIGESQYSKLSTTVKSVEKELNKNIANFTQFELLVYLFPTLSKTVVNHLILSGAFDDFSADRRELLYYNNVALQLTDRETAQLKLNPHNSFVEGLKSLKVNKSRQKTIDGLIHSIEQPQSSLKDNDIWKNKTEEDLLGIPLSCSKLDESAKLDADTTCKEYNDGKGGNSSLAVEIITSKEIITKKSEKMAFLEIEDDTDCMTDIAVFPDKWEEYKNILYVGNTIVLTGYKSKTNSFIVQKATQI